MMPSRERYRSLLLVFAIALLCASEFVHVSGPWRASLFFAHLGAFLLWQPLVAADSRLRLRDTIIVAGAAVAITLMLSPWVMLLWTALVAALVGGRAFDFSPRDERWLHLGALTFLIAFLFTLVLPDLLAEPLRSQALAPVARHWIEAFLTGGLVLMLAEAVRLLRGRRPAGALPGMYDLIHSVWILLLLLLVSFFGIALMALGGRGYLPSIGITLVSVGGLLLMVDFLLRRTADGIRRGGLAMLFSRYLLSYAIPYEQWLERLARLSRDEADAERFFALAMRAIGELTPVRGAAWQGATGVGAFGEMGGAHEENFVLPVPDEEGAFVEVRVVTGNAMSAAMAWHIRLLLLVAVQFHAAKAREERLRAQQYMRVVHETGARLTHDVKNLLQSLDGLIAAASALPEDRAVREVVARQLPEISRRLAQTLAKLGQPGDESAETVMLRDWWAGLRAQYASQGVRFADAGRLDGIAIPAAMFSGVADNLLQNALQKRRTAAGLAIRVGVFFDQNELRLDVADDGDPVDAEIARQLFQSPVASKNGLGIGLYQMGQLAAKHGTRLQLAENERGRVRFELRYHVGDTRVQAQGT